MYSIHLQQFCKKFKFLAGIVQLCSWIYLCTDVLPGPTTCRKTVSSILFHPFPGSAGADHGFSWGGGGGGGRKRLCARTHITSWIQSPPKGPKSSHGFDALSCYLSLKAI